MPVLDLYFKRQRAKRGELPDVYVYDTLPHRLRVQIVHIWDEVLGDAEAAQHESGPAEAYDSIVRLLAKELGRFELAIGSTSSSYWQWRNHFLAEKDIELALSMVELAFKCIDGFASRAAYRQDPRAPKKAEDAIKELNVRFREHGCGYQFVDREIVRIDSQLLHAEVVQPALRLLQGRQFEGAHEEFLKAHEHHRRGEEKAALTEALKSIESLLKAICAKRGWAVHEQATAKHLLGVVFEHGLIPSYWESHFSGLRSTLESGVPTARNREGGHGQGVQKTVVPPHLTAYVLHQTAAAIVFLAEAEATLPA